MKIIIVGLLWVLAVCSGGVWFSKHLNNSASSSETTSLNAGTGNNQD